jgi:hypothetical protein
MEVEKVIQSGAFIESLKRNNAKIKADRATAITEDVYIVYKRKVEDLEMQIKKFKRERDNMLDLSPSTADSLILAADFDGPAFVEKDIEVGVKIRNLEIKLKIAKERFETLFGTGS